VFKLHYRISVLTTELIVSTIFPEVSPISVKRNSPFLTAISISPFKELFADTQISLVCLFWGICHPLLSYALEITVKNDKQIMFN